jgi:hypothetical protein
MAATREPGGTWLAAAAKIPGTHGRKACAEYAYGPEAGATKRTVVRSRSATTNLSG